MYDRAALGEGPLTSRQNLTEVERLPEQGRLRLVWEDGFSAELEYRTLRGFCPCAGCQGHGTGEVEFKPPPGPIQPLSIRPVGNYAISIQWSDGHDTGIYRFDFLRRLAAEPPPTENPEGEA